jgi:hypothetical protein
MTKGRVQLEVRARFPWAKAFIWRKYGIWCFETYRDAQAVKPGETPRLLNPKKP